MSAVVRRLKNATSDARGMIKSRSLLGEVDRLAAPLSVLELIEEGTPTEPVFDDPASGMLGRSKSSNGSIVPDVAASSSDRSLNPSLTFDPEAKAQMGDIARLNRCKLGLGGITSIEGTVRGDR